MYVGFDSISITNYNQVDFVVELDLTGGTEPSYWTWVRVDTSPITTADQGIYADFVSQTYDEDTGCYYLNYHIENLDYDTTYYCSADVRSSNDYTAPIVMSSIDTFQTNADPSYIVSVNITQKHKKAYFDITVKILTNDTYNVILYYNLDSATPVIHTAKLISTEGTAPDIIYHFRTLNLKSNKKYKYRIVLRNVTHSQTIQELTGEFISEKFDSWKLWMYLHYYI